MDTADSAEETGGDTGASAAPEDLSLTLSEKIPVVIVATWRSASAEAGVAHFGVGEQELGQVQAVEEAGLWRAVLVGVPPETEAWVEPWHGEVRGEIETILTGGLPYGWGESPAVVGEHDGFVLTHLHDPSNSMFQPVIVNGEGEPVWWHTYTGARELYGSRLRQSPDAQRMYYNIFQIDFAESGAFNGVISVSMDGGDVEAISLPTAHHDFWLHDDGAIVYLSYDIREVNGFLVMGDALVRRESDGTETTIWSLWDDLTLPVEPTYDLVWGHANALEYVAEDDTYLIGLRLFSSIFKIDASTGERVWSFGQEDSAFDLDDPFEWQHGFDISGDELLIFDNHKSTESSRVVSYTLNEAAGTSEVSWQYAPKFTRYTYNFGDVLTLESGVIISWGQAGLIEQISYSGEEIWSLTWREGTTVGFIEHLEHLVP